MSTVTSDLVSSWSISSVVDTDLDVSWLIRGLVDTDLATSWEITGGVTSALDMSWSIQNALVSDLDTSWMIDVLHSDLGMSWAIVSTATIIVDGQNITTYCDIKRSVFEMHAGPLAGTAKIYVKDVGHTVSIATGSEITLDVHGVRQWGGYVMSITREFAFPVDDTAVPADTPRYFVLDCADYNILFSKRFIVNKADETARVPKYPAGKHDDVIVHDLVANYLNLEGDGLTHTQVYHVGTPQEDNPGSPAVPGMDWATAMKNTALLPGAIFYIDADKDLVYADVDVANAPFALSDEPNDTTSFGYRDMSIVEDGTMLANDAFVWGTGLGQDSMTFRRYEAEASQSEHGVWQWADYRQDLYKPQSVLKRATTYVDGSTQNNRGHKDPAVTIRCTTSKPGLRAGMKVHFICGIHGYDDIIPIRSMNIRFVNSTDAVYQLVLAHYLDEAWNTAEFPPLKGEPEQDRHCEQPTCTPTYSGLTDTWTRTTAIGDAPVFDDFTRTVSGLGTATNGNTWSASDSESPYSWSVNGSVAVGSVGAWGYASAVLSVSNATDVTFEAQLVSGSGNDDEITVHVSNPTWSQYAFLRLTRSGNTRLYAGPAMGHAWTTGTVAFGAATRFKARIQVNATTTYGKLWPAADAEPEAWTLTLSYSSITVSLSRVGLDVYSRNGTVYSAEFDNIVGAGQPEDGWGTSDAGIDWADRASSGEASLSGTTGVLTTWPASQPGNASAQTLVTDLPTSFEATVQFTSNHDPEDMTPSDTFYPASLVIRDDSGLYLVAIQIKQTLTSGGASTYLEFAHSLPMESDVQTCPITISKDTWYNLRLRAIPSNLIQGKVWAVGGSEPGWTYSTLATPNATYTNVILAHSAPSGHNFASGNGYLITQYDNLDVIGVGAGSSICSLTGAYSPGSLSGTTVDGDPVTIIEVDPEAGTFTYEADGDVIICYLTTDSDTPPGGYDGGPVYRPRHVRQLGWGTPLDGENCTMASACIALDRHTMGAKTATPPQMRAAQLDQVGGTDLNDARYAWLHGFSETLSVSYGISWSSFVARVNGGRGAILQGIYSQIPNAYSAQPSFDGGHAMYVNEFSEDGDALVYDPLAGGPIWMPASILQDYAEAWGGGNCAAAFTRVTG